jgi:hypothetical protein
MNLIKLLDAMCPDTNSAEDKDRFYSRRDAFKQFGDFSKKVAMAAVLRFLMWPRLIQQA